MNSRVEIVPTETITAAAVTWVEIAPAVTTVEATLAIYPAEAGEIKRRIVSQE